MREIVIATTTLSRQLDTRAKLAVKTAKLAYSHGHRVIVVDGGSTPELTDLLGDAGCFVYAQEDKATMGSARRQAVSLAAGLAEDRNGLVVWMEPEKWPLVESLYSLAGSLDAGKADMVLPSRTMTGFSTYPPEQSLIEQASNLGFSYMYGKKLDMWFGPRVMNQAAVERFLGYDGRYGDLWDSIFIPVVQCIADGLSVQGVEVNYIHPPEQTQEETGNAQFLMKRVEQCQKLLSALQKFKEQ